jgi:hypothetical protein
MMAGFEDDQPMDMDAMETGSEHMQSEQAGSPTPSLDTGGLPWLHAAVLAACVFSEVSIRDRAAALHTTAVPCLGSAVSLLGEVLLQLFGLIHWQGRVCHGHTVCVYEPPGAVM